MNRTITISILILVTAILAGTVYTLQQAKNQPLVATVPVQPAEPTVVTSTPIAKPESGLQSTTTDTDNTYITDPSIPIQDRCETITLECLQAQPEWDPSPGASPMWRVQNIAGIEEMEVRSAVNNSFEILTTPYVDGEEYCSQWAIDPVYSSSKYGFEEYLCSKYGFEDYRTIAIRSMDTQEIIHMYQVAHGYTILDNLGFPSGTGYPYGNTIYANSIISEPPSILIAVSSYSSGKVFNNHDFTSYKLDPYTGVLTIEE